MCGTSARCDGAAVIGLTGGVATGKSTLAGVLRRAGAAYYSIDEAAHALYRPGSTVWRRLLGSFGRGLAGGNGAISRNRLGKAALASPGKLRLLESIVHPVLRREAAKTLSRMRVRHRVVVVEAGPLLFRLGLHRHVDLVVLTHCSKDEQVRRLCRARGVASREARGFLRALGDAQASLGKDLALVRDKMRVDTSGKPLEMIRVARRIRNRVREILRRKSSGKERHAFNR